MSNRLRMPSIERCFPIDNAIEYIRDETKSRQTIDLGVALIPGVKGTVSSLEEALGIIHPSFRSDESRLWSPDKKQGRVTTLRQISRRGVSICIAGGVG